MGCDERVKREGSFNRLPTLGRNARSKVSGEDPMAVHFRLRGFIIIASYINWFGFVL